MTRILYSIPLLYLVMLLPGRLSISDLFHGTWYYPQMMLESGLLSVWYLILTLSVSPVLSLIRRKHFGLLSFLFAAVHLLHYIRYTYDVQIIWIEFFELEFTVGWIAFALFLALAVTSNRASTRVLGRSWKRLHTLIYPAAALTYLHWYLFDHFTARVLFWLAVPVAIKLAHGAIVMLRNRTRETVVQAV